VRLPHPLDTNEAKLVAVPPHGEPDRVARSDVCGFDDGRLAGHRHQLHSAHVERGHRLVSHQDHARRGTRDQNAAHFVGRGAQHSAEDAGRERGEENTEEQDETKTAGDGESPAGCRVWNRGRDYFG
jgi:hypothetical protein